MFFIISNYFQEELEYYLFILWLNVRALIDGPKDDAGDVDGSRYEPTTALLPEIYAKAITTYPQFPGIFPFYYLPCFHHIISCK